MRKFGLVGYPLGHSFSRGFFERKFRRENLTDCTYENFEIEHLEQLPRGLDGFNVTIPHKQTVIRMLESLDEAAATIGAVNCVDRNMRGFNTDVLGFEKSLTGMLEGQRPAALVLGTGGASRAVRYVLDKLGMQYTQVSRVARRGHGVISYDELTSEVLDSHRLIINTTPLGMSPHTSEAPRLDYTVLGNEHFVFDLVYNPAETMLLRLARRRGATVKNGYEMLVEQAEQAWRIWNRF